MDTTRDCILEHNYSKTNNYDGRKGFFEKRRCETEVGGQSKKGRRGERTSQPVDKSQFNLDFPLPLG